MKNRWIVSLSDGQTIKEDELQGKLSPWLQLRNYLLEHKEKKITSIQVVINRVVYNTPSIRNKKNAEFINEGNPDRLWFAKKETMIFFGGWKPESYYGLSYRVGDYRHWLWINTANNETHFEVKLIKGNEREEKIEKFYDEVS